MRRGEQVLVGGLQHGQQLGNIERGIRNTQRVVAARAPRHPHAWGGVLGRAPLFELCLRHHGDFLPRGSGQQLAQLPSPAGFEPGTIALDIEEREHVVARAAGLALPGAEHRIAEVHRVQVEELLREIRPRTHLNQLRARNTGALLDDVQPAR